MGFLDSIFGSGAKAAGEGAAAALEGVGKAAINLRSAFTGEVPPEVQVKLAELDTATVQAVNATMQAEAKSEHWVQYSWRPMIGFTFAGVIINNYIFLPYLRGFGLMPIDIPEGIWSALLVVLGVAAGTRGLEKIKRS